MELTLEELKERLAARVDEITLMELMEITSEDLVERFVDIIEMNPAKFLGAIDDWEEEDAD